ncbi:PAS domain S-box-containing protein [Halogeometricum rufum]|uniref:PAS domain S-box-containing protein n=1 Tax=Halogeometricum rufum TaxID=553469 RepID=A0A1I6GZI2_9EURY|nr:PAS domain S-box protein [Halogeometricum rufum]SFR47606.1 PAS domain S-box-containing protein [Halogeometricum rufum]
MASPSPRNRLYNVFADPDRDLEEKVGRALRIGTEYLDLPFGFLTRIDEGVQEIVQATGDHDLLQPGETCPLDDAYCRLTVELDSPLAVDNASASAIDQRAVDTFGLGTYIGTKVVVDGETEGTICFADTDVRDEPFTEAEEMFLELLGRLVSGERERRAYERQLAERNARLEREKRRFEAIAETSFDILFRVGLDAEFTYVSSAVERVLGHPPAALTGEPFVDFMTDAAAERAGSAYAEVLENRTVENLELDFLDRTGSVVVLEVNATPVTRDGDVVGVQGVGRDVTARKERQRELRIKNRAMDEAQVGICICDVREPNEPLVYVNDGFERVTGYDTEELLGRNCRMLQGERTDPATTRRFRAAIDAEEPVVAELVNYRRDGTPFWNRVHLAPVDDETGAVTHYVGFQQDVTERKRTEQLIRVLNRVLRHNLRNDVNAFLGWTDQLNAGDGGDVDAERRIERVAEDLLTTSERARELERYARRERTPERLDPGALLAGVVDATRERWPAATIRLSVRTDPETGICAGAELERAVEELVENAVKHDPSAEPSVAVEAEADGEWVRLVVADDGPGIDGMESDVVAAGTETPLEHGSGLGLWLVNWVVTRYGGSFAIEAESDGSGTTATVRLPRIERGTPVEAAARRPAILSE